MPYSKDLSKERREEHRTEGGKIILIDFGLRSKIIRKGTAFEI